MLSCLLNNAKFTKKKIIPNSNCSRIDERKKNAKTIMEGKPTPYGFQEYLQMKYEHGCAEDTSKEKRNLYK